MLLNINWWTLDKDYFRRVLFEFKLTHQVLLKRLKRLTCVVVDEKLLIELLHKQSSI